MIDLRCPLVYPDWASRLRVTHFSLIVLNVTILVGCASLPPGSNFPKAVSSALVHPGETRLGRQFGNAGRQHGGNSGFRIIPVGADGFLIRMQMIEASQQTLDLQYFVFRGDETGKLLTAAVLHAADRGVRVRVLVDDGDTESGDEGITALEVHPSIQVRIFNPFVYRGHAKLFRNVEFLFDISRLDYRMHNKLFIVDNAIALIGGRNIGDQFFQMAPESQVADDDIFAAGPIAMKLSATFDEFWNSDLSIPAEALVGEKSAHAALNDHREILNEQRRQMKREGIDYVKRAATGEPFKGMLSGHLPLIWARAQLVYDSPNKKKVKSGAMYGRLMQRELANTTMEVKSELLMVTPYLIPGNVGMRLIKDLRCRNVRVRILTNSLESSEQLLAHSGYMHYRVPLLENGIELYEIRALLGNTKGSGQTAAISRHGNYSLHAKLFVFDRQKLFIGSMNFDQRSMHINTEIGLIIDSPELAKQLVARFEAMVQPVNAYQLVLHANGTGDSASLVWRTHEGANAVELDMEPARSDWQRAGVNFISLFPLDDEL